MRVAGNGETTIRPDGARDMAVPEIVAAGPPGESVVLAITMSVVDATRVRVTGSPAMFGIGSRRRGER